MPQIIADNLTADGYHVDVAEDRDQAIQQLRRTAPDLIVVDVNGQDPHAAGLAARRRRIKCNVGRTGERIYHLPFDQQYDTTVISPDREECVSTAAEAEALPVRRAWRWHRVAAGTPA
jgi:CheY-like chemotaxis protein